MRTVILLASILLSGLFATPAAARIKPRQTPPTGDHTATEKAVREALYGMSLATLSGDAVAFKKYAAQRTFGFYDLVFSELATNPKVEEQFRKIDVTSGWKFIEFGLRTAARRAATTTPEKLQETARAQAAVTLTFKSDEEVTAPAQTGSLKIVLEKGEWKVDLTEPLKKSLLPALPLSGDSKARIEKY